VLAAATFPDIRSKRRKIRIYFRPISEPAFCIGISARMAVEFMPAKVCRDIANGSNRPLTTETYHDHGNRISDRLVRRRL
jgi:hypothetical protein